MNVGNGNGLAVNSTPNTNWNNEATSFNPGEGWVFKFNTDVRLVELDFASQGSDVIAVLSSSGFADKTLDAAHGDAAGTHNLDDTFVSAGTAMTLQFTTYITDDVLRLSSFTVEALATTNTLTETPNGTSYAWLDRFFLGLESDEDYLMAEASDSDGDRLTAGEEYVAGTVPTNAASVLKVDSIGTLETNQVVTWQSEPGKYYSIIVSTNLTAFSKDWKTVANNIHGLDYETSHTTTIHTATAAFHKVGIEKREIYLLIGQSNMAGRGPIEAEDEGVIDGCELFNTTEDWEPATNPLNAYSTIRKDLDQQQLNPGYGFALRMHEVRPEINIGLVVNARGGTNINDWEKGDLYYEEAVARTQAALADSNSRLAGILWHQGESNSSQTNTYMGKLVIMIENLRTDLGEPDLPFVIGELERDDVTVEVKERLLNEVLYQLPTMLDNTAVATTEGLVTQDGTHFDSAGQRELGRRYAEALLSIE